MSLRRRILAVLGALAALSAAAPVVAGFAGSDVFLPMAGRQAGVHPSNWFTTVWVHNPGGEPATARIYFLERGTANPSPPWVDVLVGPGGTEKLENVVETYFHEEAFGALRVTCATQKLVVTSRVYSRAVGAGESDSVGQDFAGVPASFAIGVGERSQILGAYQTQPAALSEYRSNFGVVETTGHSAWVRVRALDDGGTEVGRTEFQVREWSQRQVAFKDHFPGVSTESARLEVEVTSGTGKVIAYGSQIANGSQDPTTFEMVYAEQAHAVQHDATLVGDGSAAAPLGLADGAVGKAKVAAPGGTAGQVLGTDGTALQWVSAGAGDITAVTTAAGSGLTGGAVSGEASLAIAPAGVTETMLAAGAVSLARLKTSGVGPEKVLTTNGTDLKWSDDGLKLPFSQEAAYSGAAVNVVNSLGSALRGESTSGFGVVAAAGGIPPGPIFPPTPVAVAAVSQTGFGVYALGDALGGVFGGSSSATGVYGYSVTSYGVKGLGGGTYSGTPPLALAGVAGLSSSSSGVLGASNTYYGVWAEGSGGINAVGHGATYPALHAVASGGAFGAVVQATGAGGGGVRAIGRSDSDPDIELGATALGDDGLIYSDRDYPTSDIGLQSMDRVWVDLDDDNNSSDAFFQVRAGDNTELMRVQENGGVRFGGLAYGSTKTLCASATGDVMDCALVMASDARLKTDVVPIGEEIDVLAGLARLTGVRYFWDTTQPRARDLGPQREVGLIAQDLETVVPELVMYDAEGYRSIDYARLTAFLVEVAKAQQGLIDNQTAMIRELLARVAALEAGTPPAPARPAGGDGR